MDLSKNISELERTQRLIGLSIANLREAKANLSEAEGGTGPVVRKSATTNGPAPATQAARKPLSAAARKRISLAQKRRHALARANGGGAASPRRAQSGSGGGRARTMRAGGVA